MKRSATATRLSLAVLAGLWGCAAGAREQMATRPAPINPGMLDAVLQTAPVGADQNLRAETLLTTDECSIHLLQFRVGEQRHIHSRHDLTFTVHRGMGFVFVNDQRFAAKPGDVFFIPRGVPHQCVVDGPAPLVAVLVFTPPFDLKDTIPLPLGARTYERTEE